MWPESSEKPKPLRTGFTTGTCATACCLAAAMCLLKQNKLPDKNNVLSVTLPKGKIVELQVNIESRQASTAEASTVKDAGDDPDVTHGALISVELKLFDEPAVTDSRYVFKAGRGVGTVTRKGLALDVGEAAINPVPRQMIKANLDALAKTVDYRGGFEITVSVKNGEELALKTMNPRLGIVGGLSILGTSGIVRPFSCAAWIASIYQGIDVARANGLTHIAACTGNSSESAVCERYHLEDMALIEMGDFVGAVLKHLKKCPLEKLSICGGFGKLSKLAQGHMDLNSRVHPIDLDYVASVAVCLGASSELEEKIKVANTSIEALALCEGEGINLADEICVRALNVAKKILPHSVSLEVLAINRQGNFVGRSGSSVFTALAKTSIKDSELKDTKVNNIGPGESDL